MTTHPGNIPVAPSMEPALAAASFHPRRMSVDKRVIRISAAAIAVAIAAGLIAQVLIHLIALITNIAFYHRISFESVTPAGAPSWGLWVVATPIVGGVIVGLMARYGSKAIRGHGIPEAMEQVLLNESRIPARMTFLKPLSAAIAIGTGGPFGAEGPIIATGGALGSLVGQFLETTSMERKTLLAAGSAAGMTAIFGSPVSAVLLAVELLLFEFRPRSLIPVALASSAAAGVRIFFEGGRPAFFMPTIPVAPPSAEVFYIILGAAVGLISVVVTKILYAIEDAFEESPIHWMWWPALGAVAVGGVGYFFPRTLGVGYDNIVDIIGGSLTAKFVLTLILMKFISWVISLGSGTSGGTLAPLFTIGGGIGFAAGTLGAHLFPGSAIDPRIAALVGMAAIFAGASRALLTSVVFAFETTQQYFGLLPLLGGCTASFLIASLLMRNSIMTEKIARRGVRVPDEYAPDFLEQVLVRDHFTQVVHSLGGSETVGAVRERIISRESRDARESGDASLTHQGYPILNDGGELIGVLTRRDLLDTRHASSKKLSELVERPAVVTHPLCTLREAADLMTEQGIGRLPVVSPENPKKVIGIVTRSDLLAAHRPRLRAHSEAKRSILPSLKPT